MTELFKLVPVEPTTEQKLAVCMHPDLAAALYRSMVKAAPQPPALGGEPEMLGWVEFSEEQQERIIDWYVGALDKAEPGTELIDRAHLAPLKVEIEESSAVIDQLSKILAGIAVALKGEELPLHRHGYHDLIERVTVLKLENDLRAAETDQLKARCDELEADNIKLAADRARLSAEIESLRPAYKSVLAQLDALSKPAGSDAV